MEPMQSSDLVQQHDREAAPTEVCEVRASEPMTSSNEVPRHPVSLSGGYTVTKWRVVCVYKLCSCHNWWVNCVYELGKYTYKRGFQMSCDHKRY